MRTKHLAVAVIVLGGMLATPVTSVAQPPDVSVHRFTVRDPSFWTADKLASAKEILPVYSGKPSAHSATSSAGSPTRIDSRRPAARSVSARTAEVTDSYVTYPLSTSGKLFVELPDGRFAVCSATVVNSANLSVVWTAAHCVNQGNGGPWITAGIFIPAYKDGDDPLGAWPVLEAAVAPEWLNSDSQQFDFAAMVVDEVGDQRIVDVAGGRGIEWNVNVSFFNAYGYPARDPFNGERMWTCDSSVVYTYDGFGPPPMQGIECDMTQGSSGGGWINGDSVASNTAGSFSTLPGVLFGPDYGDAAGEVYGMAEVSVAPGPLPTTEPPLNVGMTRYDRNDSPSKLDLSAVSLSLVGDEVRLRVATHNFWSPSVLMTPGNDFFVDLDTIGTSRSDYYAWIFLGGQGWVGSIQQYRPGAPSQGVGDGEVTRSGRMVEMTFDASLVELDRSPVRWFASSRFKNRTTCARRCWDYAPNRGMYALSF